MIIEQIHINSFGKLTNCDFTMSPGLNIIHGNNESGKTTLAMFIKFIFYSLSGKSSKDQLSERTKYINWDTASASGWLTMIFDNKEYRIERELITVTTSDSMKETYHETCRIVDVATNTIVRKNEIPGEVFFGVPENVFMNSVFVDQLSNDAIDEKDMSQAIENIMLSGDENVDTKKALSKLNSIRISLLHKNGDGGEIYNLKDRSVQLQQQLADAQRTTNQVMLLDASITENRIHYNESNKKYTALDSVFQAYSIFQTKHGLDVLKASEKHLEDLRRQLSEFDSKHESTGADEARSSLDNIDKAENEYQIQKAINEHSNQDYVNDMDDIIPDFGSNEDVEQADEYLRKKGARVNSSLVMIILGLVFSLGAVLMAFILDTSMKLVYIPLGVAALFVVIAIIMLISAGSASRSLKKIYKKWDVSSIEELETATSKHKKMPSDLQAQNNTTGTDLLKADEAYKNALSKGLYVAEKYGIDTKDKSAVDALNEVLKNESSLVNGRNEILREIERYDERVSSLTERYQGIDKNQVELKASELENTVAGKKAAELTQDKLKELTRVLGFEKEKLKRLDEQKFELEKRLSAAQAISSDPGEISTLYENNNVKLKKYIETNDAVILAYTKLSDASSNLRSNVMPNIIEKASNTMSQFTGGKYSDIGVTTDLSMSYNKDTATREIDWMSAGTKDVAYLSLRKALSDIFYKNSPPPEIYDESFSKMDRGRVENALKFLVDEGDHGCQSVLMTCRDLESEIASRSDRINIIDLD